MWGWRFSDSENSEGSSLNFIDALGVGFLKQIVLQMKNIDKKFPGVQALKKVNFELELGEVHALLGENGAGKSTLIKVLGGIHKPDSGEIFINEEAVNIENIKDAQTKGISIIHQEIVLVPHISVADNIFLGREPKTKLGFIDTDKMNKLADEMLTRMGLDIDVTSPVFKLTIAQQQLIEIVKAVSFDAKIIVMDEPTSSLTDKEVTQLFDIIANLKKQKVSIIYISHRLNELFQISDRVTVMRDGQYVGTKVTSETTKDELINVMVGREMTEYYTRTFHELGETILDVKGLTKKGVFDDVNFHVKKGEIVGFAGLIGAGRSEIMRALFGIDQYDSGTIQLEETERKFKNTRAAIDAGISLLPEDRKKEGLVLNNTVAFNMTLAVLKEFIKGIFVKLKKKNAIISKYIDSLSIKTPSEEQIVNNLSGGNQQKVVLAKWLAVNPKVLILDEPTRGVDVGAKAEIYAIVDKLANSGMAVIMISSELPEIINMCDRVYVVHSGKISGELKRDEFSQKKIMYYATGGI